ncbi:MAG: recombination-associated protein RdgC [Mariprofundaceae bacterium]
MFFKNIHFYHFEDSFKMTGNQLHEALTNHKARSCGQMELACEGWIEPLGLEGHTLVHEVDGKLMFCLRREDKVLPASLIRERMDEKAFQIEQEQGRPVGRKEKMDIKDHLLQELLPKALVRASHTFAYIDPKNSWLIINAISAKRAEELIMLLRKSLGTLNVVLPQTTSSPEAMMTQWMANHENIPNDLDIEDEVELRLIGEQSSVIRCKHVDLSSQEIQAHVSAGKRVYRLAMNWQGRISFILHDDLSLHRIRFDNELIEDFDAGGDEVAQFDADFSIMAAEFEEFIPLLLKSISPEDDSPDA